MKRNFDPLGNGPFFFSFFLFQSICESDSSIQSLSFKLFPSFCVALPWPYLGFLRKLFSFLHLNFAKIFKNFSKFLISLTSTFPNRFGSFFRVTWGFWGCPLYFCTKICKNFKILQKFLKILDFPNFYISQPIWFVFSVNLGFLWTTFSFLH